MRPIMVAVLSCSIRTLYSDIKVTSVNFHDTRGGQQQVVREGQSGWGLQAVISRASFRRLPRNGKSFFTMILLRINNQFAKKRGIREEVVTYSPYCNAARARGHGCRRLTSIIE